MGKIIYFDYCALIILVILFISTIFRRMTKGRLNHCFFVLLLVSVLSVLADIAAVNLDKMGAGYITAKYVAHTAYLLLHNLTPAFYIIYLVAQTDTWHRLKQSRIQKVLLWLPFLVEVAALAMNPVYHMVFYLDGNDTYTRGSYFLLLYVVVGIYIMFGFLYIYHYRRLFSKRRYAALIVNYPFMLLSVVIQYFFPNFIVEMFANACGLLFISMMVQRPEETIDTETGLGKLSAYVTDMKRAFSNEKPVEIILINVANYNAVRDMLGYDGMNEVLHKIADDMIVFNRKQGLEAELYYLGDGKFRFVIDYRHFDQTEEMAQRINSLMKEDLQFNQMELNLVTCVCIAKCPEDIHDVDSLLAFGDDLNTRAYTGKVLYASQIYKKEYYDIMKDIDQIIERALSEHKFSVYYQPIYSVNEQCFHSAEALLRLKDDKYGFISPEIFIPAAEKSGAIHKIGAFVLDEVCRFIASEEYKTLQIDYIEINLSVVQCMQNDLAKQILDTLDRYHVTPDQINLEITETAASYSQKTMIENLSILDAAGIQFSLDDFGTGYSNMRRIASLPLHIVKLDKSFANMQENARLQIILQNTIKMIKAMDMQIVVEGIENEELVKQFSEWKCEYIQGYYYSKPIPREEFVHFIQASMA
ncbi:MAG: EAL domain-containing protein [Lachnospiraceae bacterium]